MNNLFIFIGLLVVLCCSNAAGFSLHPSYAFSGTIATSLLASSAGRSDTENATSCAAAESEGVNLASPSIWEEAEAMLSVALLTYTYASLREYARKNPGNVKGEEVILNDEPATGKDVYGFVLDNADIISKNKEFSEFEYNQFQALLGMGQSKNLMGQSEDLSSKKVVIFNDKYPRHSVYGIALNKNDKRITLSFRGTHTVSDGIDDIKAAGARVSNPLYKETENQETHFNIHQGFYDCLFRDKEGGKNGKTKFQVIMDQLIQLKAEHPDYRIYITGHSLGAALATIFTFFASTPQYFGVFSPFPVTCISIASPLVGDDDWRNAFMLQEKLGTIRHLRISNFGDVVPKVPIVALDLPTFTFKHVGVHLQLYEDKPHRFSFPSEGNTPLIDKKEDRLDAILPKKALVLHGCDTYYNRLKNSKEVLEKIGLDDLYRNDLFVGKHSNV